MNTSLKADILVNGFRGEKIDMEQSVKQGEELSFSLFILCMDTLTRKGNSDALIQGLNIENPTTVDCVGIQIKLDTDDIVFITKNKHLMI